MAYFWIEVTQDCIDYGTKQPESCPVALGAMLAGIPRPSVGYTMLTPHGEGFRASGNLLSAKAKARIADFDAGKGMQPFDFTIEIGTTEEL